MRISRKGMPRHVKLTRTTLPPSRKGANKRGICAHKMTQTHPTHTKPTSAIPQPVAAYAMRFDR